MNRSFWKAGHAPTLLSAFLYFDVSFMVWYLLGPLQVQIAQALALDTLQRALLIAVYLAMPRTEMTFYLFAAGLGFTWLATVPPTAAIIGKLFGVRHLGTLFGLTLLTHQIGGFLGAWLGGLAVTRYGDFSWMWYADMALAALAAFVNLPIREAPVNAVPQAA